MDGNGGRFSYIVGQYFQNNRTLHKKIMKITFKLLEWITITECKQLAFMSQTHILVLYS